MQCPVAVARVFARAPHEQPRRLPTRLRIAHKGFEARLLGGPEVSGDAGERLVDPAAQLGESSAPTHRSTAAATAEASASGGMLISPIRASRASRAQTSS